MSSATSGSAALEAHFGIHIDSDESDLDVPSGVTMVSSAK